MVDFQSRFRMYSYGFTSPERKIPVATRRELYHDTAPLIFKRRPQTHDCRVETVKEHEDKRDWEAWLLSRGLEDTCRSVDLLHYKEITDKPGEGGKRKPDKLIIRVGLKGSGDGDFVYPRGLTSTLDGDIIVADTGNNRIQIFNNYGVFKKKIGAKGSGKGQFDEPTGVTELPNGDIAVADKSNKRVQVFDNTYAFKYEFPTCSKPYAIASDQEFNIVVSTMNRTVEVYRRGGKLMYNFPVGAKQKAPSGFNITLNNKDEVIVSDPMDSKVKFFTYSGKVLYKFEPVSNNEGLAVMPSGVARTSLDQFVVADSLNHTVNLYTERGILLQQILCPTDDIGTVQACALGPEGHLITLEYSIMGQHSLKIFRYRPCDCHASRPNSSKRRTPTPQTS
ncbi:TRIM2-like protein [Mya arenaria]|uniref:TRIM2-like protein n=1 Tax=Mya arenaria TaxID=6604 RepID=A0ABY7EDJ1_MYAAR|nr:tripartite motif-containing protein 2-like [Mya arenaria]XP_052811271.1 tripartite motif-containing protein 2-like [Mya arenaria]WAR08073.1 TRIM2-like protein [Mya arenaria]